VRFLGEVQPQIDSGARDSWRAAAEAVAPFKIGFGALGRFPPRGRPRVLWVAVRQEQGAAGLPLLAERVEQAARAVGFDEENRPFRAHLTLARAARGQAPTWSEGVVPGIEELVEVDRLVLFQSRLSPSGARYTALDSFALEGRGRKG
jgi:2'-5' RNA ligase